MTIPAVFSGRLALFALVSMLILSLACSENPRSSLNHPLPAFHQQITSPVHRLRMRPGEAIQLPVVITNTGDIIFTSRGTHPVLASYGWYSGAIPVPTDSDRTTLPDDLAPGQQMALLVTIISPWRGRDLSVSVSLVQEGVAWFNTDRCRIPVELIGADAPSNSSDEALHSFQQSIRSELKTLTLHRGETASIPVVIKNVNNEPLSSIGLAPVLLSYKWFDQGTMLPAEGERTPLPAALLPGDSVAIAARVTAPKTGRELVLKITLVQEGVAWFMSKGGSTLDLPVRLE